MTTRKSRPGTHLFWPAVKCAQTQHMEVSLKSNRQLKAPFLFPVNPETAI